MSKIMLAFYSSNGKGHASLIINGGIINITNGAKLVVDNSDNSAIIQTGSGYIQSEGASDDLK
jgi:hypothetical protein